MHFRFGVTTDEKIERLMYRAGKTGDDFVTGLCRTALGQRPDAGADEVARCRALCEALAEVSENDQLREDNKYLREQIAKVRSDRDTALTLIDELEADLGRVQAENTALLTKLGGAVHERERALETLVENLRARLERLERGGQA